MAAAGTMEFVKRWQPKEGDIVTFRHRGFLFGSNRPKAPALYRLRTDMTWQDVIENWKGTGNKIPGNIFYFIFVFIHFSFLGTMPVKIPVKRVKGKGFWRDVRNRREWFIHFAKDKGFDPLQATNWQQITDTELRSKVIH